MNSKHGFFSVAAPLAGLITAVAVHGQHNWTVIETVAIGDPGNPADTRAGAGSEGFGSVDYEYHIGKYKITNEQYAAFLNAVAATDTYGLYHTNNGTNEHGGIVRSGSSGNYTYAVRTPESGINAGQNMAKRPVHIISFYSAARFANWLMNGQPSGPQDASTTEDGFYTFDGQNNIIAERQDLRHPDNDVFWVALPTEDEWYKAAYYDPSANDGEGYYYRYPTRSDTVPVAELPPGGENSANFGSLINTTTDVDAYPLTYTYYGAFDMGGNAWERNDTIIDGNRGRRGGAYNSAASGGTLLSTHRNSLAATSLASGVGFRIASSGPLPGPVRERQTLQVRDSNDFEGGSYEADVLPDAASPQWAKEADGGVASASGGILSLQTDTSGILHYRSEGAPGGNFWDGNFDNGFTVEFRVWVEEVHDPEHGAGLFAVRNGGRGGQAQLQFRADSIRWWNGDTHPVWIMAEGEDHTAGYQTIRIVKMPGKNEWHVWRNGVLAGAHMRSVTTTVNELIFGDTSDAQYSGKIHFDYVRWDNSGAYAPSEASAEVPGLPSVAVAGQVVEPAVEIEVGTWDGVPYRIHGAGNLEDWADLTGWETGTGAPAAHLFSTLGMDRGFYRAEIDEK